MPARPARNIDSGTLMPGMNSGTGAGNVLVTAAFRAALTHQLLIAAAIFLLLWLARLIAASWWPSPGRLPAAAGPEPAGRRLLRIGFGVLWIFDGILQAQPAMPAGLPSQVTEPSAAGSPAWVRHLVNWGGNVWTYHPVQLAAASVWIQVGIGLWLIVGRRGPWSRFGALAGAGWGLVVWVFGEAFGSIFAPGVTWLFGAPGGAGFYCAAGALLALPEGAWRSPRLGRFMLAGMGAFFAGMAVLQAWPGRGFWQGTSHGRPGTLTGMIAKMVQTPQPRYLARMVSAFANFTAAHGFAVNLFSVIALAAIGAAFLGASVLSARLQGASSPGARFAGLWPWLAVLGVGAGIVFCLADWLLIEDLGFLGGLGTDPNSMIPMVLLFVSGYLVLTRPAPAPGVALQPSTAPDRPAVSAGPTPLGAAAGQAQSAGPEVLAQPARPGVRPPGRLASALKSAVRPVATASPWSIAAAGALGITLLGVLPAAAATANPNADPIIAQAIDGTAGPADYRAAGFTLTSQQGRPVSLASLRGKVVLLTFLDPVCTNDCPVIGREFAEAGRLLAAESSRVELAAVVASTTYRSVAVMQAYDSQEGRGALPDWMFLTGSVAQLRQVWHDYAVAVQTLPAGAMTLHSDLAYAINPAGRVRQVLDMDPGPGTAASQSSFAVQLANAARQLLGSR
jgi:cytochrome oxidase Cu insertion factor (SCO1/SenC/PrrC family)